MWLDSVEDDLQVMGFRNWKRKSQDRDQGKVRVEQAKVYVVPVEEEDIIHSYFTFKFKAHGNLLFSSNGCLFENNGLFFNSISLSFAFELLYNYTIK